MLLKLGVFQKAPAFTFTKLTAGCRRSTLWIPYDELGLAVGTRIIRLHRRLGIPILSRLDREFPGSWFSRWQLIRTYIPLQMRAVGAFTDMTLKV